MTVRAELERVRQGYPRVPGREDRMASALLAVLDLHTEDKFGECRECCSESHVVNLPCATVLAIEREMGREVDR